MFRYDVTPFLFRRRNMNGLFDQKFVLLWCPLLSLSLSLTHYLSLKHALTLSHSTSLIHTLSLSFLHSYTHSFLFLIPSPSLSLTPSLFLPLSPLSFGYKILSRFNRKMFQGKNAVSDDQDISIDPPIWELIDSLTLKNNKWDFCQLTHFFDWSLINFKWKLTSKLDQLQTSSFTLLKTLGRLLHILLTSSRRQSNKGNLVFKKRRESVLSVNFYFVFIILIEFSLNN